MHVYISIARWRVIALMLAFSLLINDTDAQTITTIAGGIGDNLPAATYARLIGPGGIAIDASGNMYIADGNGRVRKVSPSGIMTTVAGIDLNYTSSANTSLSGPGVYAQIYTPSSVATDAIGNLYISFRAFVGKVDLSGKFTIIAGNLSLGSGFSGDGSLATTGQLSSPSGIAVDALGNVYIADRNNNRVRKVNAAGIINTIAGGGPALGDGGPAISAALNGPTGITLDATGNIIIADQGNSRIRKIDASGIISTIAGGGGSTVNGIPATSFYLWAPVGVAADGAGNIYITGQTNSYIVNASGIINSIAGTYSNGFSGDGGPATAATLNNPTGIVLDKIGNIYISDGGNNCIRKISTSGIISTVIGNRVPITGFGGDGGVATLADFNFANGLAADNAGGLYIADNGNSRIRKINAAGIITTIAGNGITGFNGDGMSATAAELDNPLGVALDRSGNLYIADQGTNHIRKINTAGIITSIAGGGVGGLGDGGPATAAVISAYGVAVDTGNNVYIADEFHNRIRKITAGGIISTIAGNGTAGHTGDGSPATAAELYAPASVAVDRVGNVYLVDNYYVRKVDTAGIITSLLSFAYPATRSSIATDSAGNVYILSYSYAYSGYYSCSIKKIDPYGYISAVAGNDTIGYMGDLGPATAAELINPLGLAIDAGGHLFIADGNSIREVCCMSSIIDKPPVFKGGHAQNLSICKGLAATPIDTFLTITDGDIGNTETWSILAPPSHGSLTGFTHTATSTGGAITPSGLIFHPDTSFSGTDHFTIQASDGTDTFTTTVTINIATTPNPGIISGASGVCATAFITLSDAVSGGTWSCSNSNATISSSGVITGVRAGTDTITYTVTKTCGTASATKVITINPSTFAGPIKGPSSVCVGSSMILSDSIIGGVWNTASPFVTVTGATGMVIGLAPGTAAVSYTVTTGCGTATAAAVVTVYPMPSAGSISGTTTLCVGGNIPLSDPVPGGVWSSGAPPVASVSGAGIVTGNAVGGAVISYSVTNGCGTAAAITIVNVVSSFPISSITGHASVCSGDTTTLHDGTPGGVWSSSLTSVATIGSTGIVTGIASGITAISYTAALGCGLSVATFILNVDHAVSAGTLSSVPPICMGATTLLSASVPGGVWGSSNAHASVAPSGIITGVSTGTDTMLYTVTNSCGTATAKQTVDVYPVPQAGIISGAAAVCSGDSILLSDPATGGAWTSSNISVATVGSTGKVMGIAGGTAIISYTVATGCGTAAAAKTIIVNAAAGIITGPTTICTGTTSVLSDPVSGGTWSSSATAVATIGSTGVVTALLAGTTIISYTVTAGCGLSATSAAVTIGTLPLIAGISGNSSVCVAATVMLSDVTIGGAWSSSNTAVAIVGSTGVVTGIAPGSGTISYTVSAPCGTNRVTYTINTESFPAAGVISGITTLCAGSAVILSDNIVGGIWSSGNTAIATISGTGLINGVSAGSTLISYSVTNSCGTATTPASITINPLPDAGIISGPGYVCLGNAITLSDAAAGGVWGSSNTSIAAVASGGVVTGLALGGAAITYAVSNGCGTDTAVQLMSVNPLPDAGAISGFTDLCIGSADTLTEIFITGTWSTGNISVASVGMYSGIVTGIAAGNATVFYNVTNSCGTATVSHAIVIDTAGVAPITGATVLCIGKIIALADLTTGGVWSSSNASVAAIDNTGIITGAGFGTAIISYAVTNSCGTHDITTVVGVDSMPSGGAISGTGTLCAGASTILGESIAGGSWSSGNVLLATVSADGRLAGISAGTLEITYTVANICGNAIATAGETIMDAPAAGFITGKNVICMGAGALLTDAIGGGTWSVAVNNIAIVNNVGMVTAQSPGVTDVFYTVSNTCGSNTTSIPLTVQDLPYIGTITGIKKTIVGGIGTLGNEIPGGTWSSSDTAIAIVSANGTVSGMGAGTVVVTYTVFNSSGCAADSTTAITVFPKDAKGNLYKIYPNPATYELTIGWMDEPDVTALVDIIDMSGRKVYTTGISMPTVNGSTVLNISNIVSGMYIVTIRSANGYYSGKLVIL